MPQVLGQSPLYIEFQVSKGWILRPCLREIKNPSPLPLITVSRAQCVCLLGSVAFACHPSYFGGKKIACTQEFGFSLGKSEISVSPPPLQLGERLGTSVSKYGLCAVT